MKFYDNDKSLDEEEIENFFDYVDELKEEKRKGSKTAVVDLMILENNLGMVQIEA